MEEKKVISEQFLKENGFKQQKDDSFDIVVKNSPVWFGIQIRVEVISPAIGCSVAIRVEGHRNFAILPIDYEFQLLNLIRSLKGE